MPDSAATAEHQERAGGTPAPDARSEPVPARLAALARRGARDPLVLAGLALFAASVLLKVYVLRQSYFVEDDFLFVGRAFAGGLTPEYLFELHKGHLMPGSHFLVYVQTAFAPYHWGTTAGTMLVLQAAAGAAVFRLLWVLFGPRWGLLPPLAAYLFAPLTIPVLAWWSAALNAVPFQLAIALALLWTVHYLRTGTARYGWLAAGAVVFGMAFSVKAMFLPPLLFAVAACFVTQGRLPGAVGGTLRRHRAFWGGMAALSLGHLWLYLARQRADDSSEGAGLPEADPTLSMVRGLLGEVFPTGTVGGPVTWGPVTPAGGLVTPEPAVLIGAWAVLALLVAASLLLRRRSWRAWAVLLGYLLVVDIVPSVIARGRYQEIVGSDPRYVADAALVFAVCLALAFLPTREERAAGEVLRRRPGRTLRDTAAVATAVYVLVAGYSTYTYTYTLSGDRVHWYLDTVRGSLEHVPDEAGLYPRPVPEDVVLPWNGPRRLSSHVLSPLADEDVAARMSRPRQAPLAMVFNDAGFLVHARPDGDSSLFGPHEGEECIPTWGGNMSWTLEAAGGPTRVVTIGYRSEEAAEVEVVLGDDWVVADLPPAPEGGNWYVPVASPGSRLLLVADEDEMCVTWVSYGGMEPAVEGNPWEE